MLCNGSVLEMSRYALNDPISYCIVLTYLNYGIGYKAYTIFYNSFKKGDYNEKEL